MPAEKVGGISYGIDVHGSPAQLEKFNAEAERLVASLQKAEAMLKSMGSGKRGRGGIPSSEASGTAGGGESVGSEKQQLSDVEKELRRIRKQRKLIADQEVHSARTLLGIDREIASIEQKIARGKQAKVQDLRTQASAQAELLRHQMERQKLQIAAVHVSREEIAIAKEFASLQRQRREAADRVLNRERAITQVTAERARIERALHGLQDQGLALDRDREQIAKTLDALKRKARLLSNDELNDERRKTAELQRQVSLEDKLAVERNRQGTVGKEAELKAARELNDLAVRQLANEQKIAEAKRRLAAGEFKGRTAGTEAAASVGLSPREVEAAGFNINTLNKSLKSTPGFADKVRQSFAGLREGLEKMTGASAGLFFTFRRLIGILAVFTLAREIASGIGRLVRATISWNAALEQVQLGIAAIVVASGQVFDAAGNTAVSAAQAIALAIPEARRQLELLRLDALRTSATFEDLSQAYQVAVAPGMQAGLQLDQIRRFAVQISQAATAIGLQQNQLAEEIRSILGGTIQIRTTRIAAALGITNEDIRQAKEMGALAEFLEKRFSSFSAAGELSLQNFNTILANLKDGILLLLGSGTLTFFEGLKDLLKDVSESVRSIDEITGDIELNPRLLGLIERFSSGMRKALESAVSFRDTLSAAQFAPIADGATAALQLLASAFSGAVSGMTASLSDAAVFARELAQGVAAVVGADLDSASDSVRTVGMWLGRILGIVIAVKTAAVALNATLGLVAIVSRTMAGLWSAWRLAAVSLVATTATFSALLAGVKTVSSTISGIWTAIQAKAVATAVATNLMAAGILAFFVALAAAVAYIIANGDVIGAYVSYGILRGIEGIKKAWAALMKFLIETLDETAPKLGAPFYRTASSIIGALSGVSDTAAVASEALRKLADDPPKIKSPKLDKFDKDIADTTQRIADLAATRDAMLADAEGKSFGDVLSDLFTKGATSLSGFIDKATDAFKPVEALSKRIEDLPAIFASSGTAAQEIEASFREAEKAIREIQGSVIVAQAQTTASLDGERSAEIMARTRIEAAEKLRDIDKEITEMQANRFALERRRAGIQSAVAALGDKERDAVLEVQRLLQNQVEAKRRIASAESGVALAQTEAAQAKRAGDAEGFKVAMASLEARKQELDLAQKGHEAAMALSDERQKQIRSEVQGADRIIDLGIEREEIEGRIAAAIVSETQALETRARYERLSLDMANARLAAERAQILLEASRVRKQRSSPEAAAQRISASPFLTEIQKREELLALYEATQARSEQIGASSAEGVAIIDDQIAALEAQQVILEVQKGIRDAALDVQIGELENAKELLGVAHATAVLQAENAATAREALLEQGDPASLSDQYLIQLVSLQSQLGTMAQNMAAVVAAPFEGMHKGLIAGMKRYLYETGDAMDVIRGLGQGVFGSLTDALAKFVADWIANTILMRAISSASSKAALTENTLAAGASAAAWTPAALMASIGSFGTAVLIGVAALGALAAFGAFAKGGYGRDNTQVHAFAGGGSPWSQDRRTRSRGPRPKGIDPRDRIQGWFRPDEFIFRPEAVRAWGTDVMYAMNDLTVRPGDFLGLARVMQDASALGEIKRSGASQGMGAVRSFASGGMGMADSASAAPSPRSGRSAPSADVSGEARGRDILVFTDMSKAMAEYRKSPSESRVYEIVDERMRRVK